jgi:hypothetical protein
LQGKRVLLQVQMRVGQARQDDLPGHILFLRPVEFGGQIVRFAYCQDAFALNRHGGCKRVGTIEGIDAGVVQNFHVEMPQEQVEDLPVILQ